MSPLTPDEIVRGLVAQGVPRETAEKQARALNPVSALRETIEANRRADVLEKAEQAVIVKMARVVGCKVYSLSQARASKQTPGLPDLWIARRVSGLAFWWETKKQIGGARSTAQTEFAEECDQSGIPYGFGDRYDFAEFLQQHGITPPDVP